MADSAHANWNAIRIVYGLDNPALPLEGRERTCFFHITQFLEKHTKQYVVHDLQEQHKHLCIQYKNASSMEEAETRFLAIKVWWTSLGAASEEGIRQLVFWLGF